MVGSLALLLVTVPARIAFGSSQAQVLASFGGGARVERSAVDASGIRSNAYRLVNGSATGMFVWDRLVGLERVWRGGTALTPTTAFQAIGMNPKGLKAKGGDRRTVGANEVQDWSLELGNGVEGTLTVNRSGGRVVEQMLELKAPPEVAGVPTVTERKAILDGLRPRVQKDLPGQPIKLVVDKIARFGPHAFVQGRPVLAATGARPDYRKSVYREAYESEAFDEGYSALLLRQGGKWGVRGYAFGATDVPYVDWHVRYGSPRYLTLPWVDLD